MIGADNNEQYEDHFDWFVKEHGLDNQPAREIRPLRRPGRTQPSEEQLNYDIYTGQRISDSVESLWPMRMMNSLVASVKDAATLPGDVYQGKVDDYEYHSRVLNLAALATLGSSPGMRGGFFDAAERAAPEKTTREVVKYTGEKMSKEKAGLLELGEGVPADIFFNPGNADLTKHYFKNEAGTSGFIHLHEKEGGKGLYIDLISSVPAGMSDMEAIVSPDMSKRAWGLGSAGTRDLLNKLQEKYPKAEYIEGRRISGARTGAAETVRIKLPKKTYDPANEL